MSQVEWAMEGCNSMSADDKERAKSVLERKIPEENIKTRPGGGGVNLRYVPPAFVIRLLNEAYDKWSFEILNFSIQDLPGTEDSYAYVLGRMTIPGVGVREQFGCQSMQKRKGADMLADTLKGASSDAMKKCASLFGVALELYEDATEPANQGYNNNYRSTTPTAAKPNTSNAPVGGKFVPKTNTTTPTPNAAPTKIVDSKWTEEMQKLLKPELDQLNAVFDRLGATNKDQRSVFVADFLGNKDARATTEFILPTNIRELIAFLKTKIEG